MFPYLVDEVTGTRMYESEDIVNYLYEKYGGGLAPNPYLFKSTLLTGWMPILFRPGRGACLARPYEARVKLRKRGKAATPGSPR